VNPADIQTGKPKLDGRYVVLVRCTAQAARDWVEPLIMTWHSGRWHTSNLSAKIVGWLGPIPVMKVADIPEEPVQEFDL
jgi:hypothetical protein